MPNFYRALDVFNALGVTGDGHGLVNRLLVVGAATQPYAMLATGAASTAASSRLVAMLVILIAIPLWDNSNYQTI